MADRVYTFLVQRRTGGKPESVLVWDTPDISVGRGAEADLVVEDAEASRHHARFVRGPEGHGVQNHSTSNPTFVNDEPIESTRLKNKDVVRIADTELVFCQSQQNPVQSGLSVEYASNLKNFGPKLAGDGESTILGLMEPASGEEEDFVVRPARDFDHELAGMEPPPLEPAAKKGGVEAFTLAEKPAGDTLQITLELRGLEPAQQASLRALMGKTLELPKLRIRISEPDLD